MMMPPALTALPFVRSATGGSRLRVERALRPIA